MGKLLIAFYTDDEYDEDNGCKIVDNDKEANKYIKNLLNDHDTDEENIHIFDLDSELEFSLPEQPKLVIKRRN